MYKGWLQRYTPRYRIGIAPCPATNHINIHKNLIKTWGVGPLCARWTIGQQDTIGWGGEDNGAVSRRVAIVSRRLR